MEPQAYYETEAAHHQVGAEIDGRVVKAGRLFQRHLGSTKRLLDIGCGSGGVAVYLGRVLGARGLHGVEISQQRVQEARARGVQAVQADLNHDNLPFDDTSFDAIFCGEVIEHLVDTDHLLDEIGRVLTPEGVCVLTTPNLAAWFNRIALLLGWQPFDTSVSLKHEVGRPKILAGDWGCRGHLQVFTCGALRELLGRHAFQILETRGTSMADVYVGLGNLSGKKERALLVRAVSPRDRVLSLSRGLGSRILVVLRKRSPSQ